jgi:L-2-hydroxyglutarate oxidase LhgO
VSNMNSSHCSLHFVCFRYLLLERPPQGTRPLASSTIFPTPDPKLGKGVLVQTTLWGNLILGPTARDVGNPQHQLTKDQCNSFILSKCKQLVHSFDVTHTFHAFAGPLPPPALPAHT